MHPVLFYRPGDRLSLPELAAARLDGHVIEVGEGYMPVDTVEEADARATGIACLVPPGTAASGPSAAWIHGAGDDPPAVHHVRRTSATRMRVAASLRFVYHEARLAPGDVQLVAGVAVTALIPTAMELLLGAALAGPDDGWLRALRIAHPGLDHDMRARLEQMPRRPGRRSALAILDAAP